MTNDEQANDRGGSATATLDSTAEYARAAAAWRTATLVRHVADLALVVLHPAEADLLRDAADACLFDDADAVERVAAACELLARLGEYGRLEPHTAARLGEELVAVDCESRRLAAQPPDGGDQKVLPPSAEAYRRPFCATAKISDGLRGSTATSRADRPLAANVSPRSRDTRTTGEAMTTVPASNADVATSRTLVGRRREAAEAVAEVVGREQPLAAGREQAHAAVPARLGRRGHRSRVQAQSRGRDDPPDAPAILGVAQGLAGRRRSARAPTCGCGADRTRGW